MFNVYKITNTINNKIYVGYSSLSIEHRWRQHKAHALKTSSNRKFYNAIRKYGVNVWEIELLTSVDTVNEAKIQEIKFIELYNSYVTGYNSTKGGDGNNGIIMTPESNEKRSNALKGVAKSAETIEKFKNRKNTEESNAKRSRAHKGMKKPWVKWSAEQIRKRSLSRRSLTFEQYLEIHNLRNSGKLIRKISEVTRINSDLVKKWLKKSWELD